MQQDSGYRRLEVGYRIDDTGYYSEGYRRPDAGCQDYIGMQDSASIGNR